MSLKAEVQWAKSDSSDNILQTKFLFISLFILLGSIACNQQKSIRDGIIIAESNKYEATIYRQNCAICHGKEGFGKIYNGKPVPSLRSGEAKKRSRAEIYEQIKHGKLPMPSFKNQLTEKEIEQMVDFVMYDVQARSSGTKGQK